MSVGPMDVTGGDLGKPQICSPLLMEGDWMNMDVVDDMIASELGRSDKTERERVFHKILRILDKTEREVMSE